MKMFKMLRLCSIIQTQLILEQCSAKHLDSLRSFCVIIVDMSIYYVSGISGSGKSTLVEALKDNGYEAYDADRELCSWFDSNGNAVEYPRNAAERPADWQDQHKFLMSEQKIQDLAAKDKDLYICGIAPNDLELADKYFAKVLFLYIPQEEMIKRVSTRENNKYGHDADQLTHMLNWYTPTVNKYMEYGAVKLDAMMPVEEVYKKVLQLTNDQIKSADKLKCRTKSFSMQTTLASIAVVRNALTMPYQICTTKCSIFTT